jgi:GNAT superfamily N-acetyltransferase
VIRAATEADAEAMSRVHRASRSAAYAHIATPEEIDDGRFTPEWWRDIIRRDEDISLVCERDGELVGIALVTGARLDQLYVDPAQKGTGAGGKLFDAAIAVGATELVVFEANAAARAFYERRGWILEPDSAHIDPNWTMRVPAVRYRLPSSLGDDGGARRPRSSPRHGACARIGF